MNVRTPRFYPDIISYYLSRGIAQDGNFDVYTGSNLIGIQTGTEAELFDMRPLNKVNFNTSDATSDHVLINIDTQSSTSKLSYVAILNHNMKTADAQFRIAASDTESHIQAADMGSATAIQPTEIVNADTINGSSPYDVAPAIDGSTIVRFSESGLRYWGIQFEGDSSNTFSGTDLKMGCIMIGEYFEMPHAPDLALKRSISFDGMTKVQQSVGGQRFSNASSFGRTVSSTTRSPFSTTTATNDAMNNMFGGRIIYDMNFSFINSTDLMPNRYHIINTGADDVIEDIWNKTSGNHLPFIFSCDKDSEGNDAESEHIFARFGQDSLDMTQVASDTFNISMRIEEEF